MVGDPWIELNSKLGKYRKALSPLSTICIYKGNPGLELHSEKWVHQVSKERAQLGVLGMATGSSGGYGGYMVAASSSLLNMAGQAASAAGSVAGQVQNMGASVRDGVASVCQVGNSFMFPSGLCWVVNQVLMQHESYQNYWNVPRLNHIVLIPMCLGCLSRAYHCHFQDVAGAASQRLLSYKYVLLF